MLPGTSTNRSAQTGGSSPHPAHLAEPTAVPPWDEPPTLEIGTRPSHPSGHSEVSDLFRPVVARSGVVARNRARGAWTAASTVLQGIAVAVAATVSAQFASVEQPVLVPVKIVRPAQPAAPPAPPPAPAATKPAAPQPDKPAPARRAPVALVQPRNLPEELKAPDPNEPPEEVWYGTGDGVVGGIPGGVDASAAAPVVASVTPPPPPPAKPVKFRSEMTPPVFVAGPALEYTQQALEREVEGTMIVDCVVDVSGTVHDCRAVRGLPFLDRAVIANLERRRYRPATLEGQALTVTYTFTLNFKLP